MIHLTDHHPPRQRVANEKTRRMKTNQPGITLDAEIADLVCGHVVVVDQINYRGMQIGEAGRGGQDIPHYSTDVTAAMTLLSAWGHDWQISRRDGRYIVTLCRPTALPNATAECLEQSNESLPLAICFVMLRAVSWS